MGKVMRCICTPSSVEGCTVLNNDFELDFEMTLHPQ